jgi:hypothetical protein
MRLAFPGGLDRVGVPLGGRSLFWARGQALLQEIRTR